MEDRVFVTLKVKSGTALHFRKFSREIGKKQTDALQIMLNFFKDHSLSPLEDLGPNMKTLEGKLNKRINNVISIIRSIEKTQTKPVLAMLQLLFQEDSGQKKPLLIEKSNPVKEKIKSNSPIKNEFNWKEKYVETHIDIQTILDQVVIARSSFGQPYLRLNLKREHLEILKSKYKNN